MLSADVNVDNPDKKSVMMYVMCYFQVLPHSNIVIEDLDFSPPPPNKVQYKQFTSSSPTAHKPAAADPTVPSEVSPQLFILKIFLFIMEAVQFSTWLVFINRLFISLFF